MSTTLAPASTAWISPTGSHCSTTSSRRVNGPLWVWARTAPAASVGELRESRARIMAAADEERRRIERDLHDGAQQRLVALRIRIELAAEAVAEGHGDPIDLLRRLGRETEEALEEVRSLAHGIYPAPLAKFGLAGALRSVALDGPIPISIVSKEGGRYRREVETAAYFCCLEAIQNATKHARGATRIRVSLGERDGALRLEVRDDGPGFQPALARPAAGLTNMQDRLKAVGGELEIRSTPGAGTRVLAAIPLDRA